MTLRASVQAAAAVAETLATIASNAAAVEEVVVDREVVDADTLSQLVKCLVQLHVTTLSTI
jgi:hypothetical protein